MIPEGKIRVVLTLTAEPWKDLSARVKKAGMPRNWLSNEIDKFVPALLAVIDLAEKDANEKRQMTDFEAMARYGEVMSHLMKKKKP